MSSETLVNGWLRWHYCLLARLYGSRDAVPVTCLTPPPPSLPAAEDQPLGDSTYKYLTVDEMKSLGDDSMPMDVSRDEFFDRSHDFHTGEDGDITALRVVMVMD